MPYFLLPMILSLFVFIYMPKYWDYIICFPVCIALTVLQFIIVILQYKGKRRTAISLYNQGVDCYNKRELLDALDYFKIAYETDPTNLTIKQAIIKTNRYLT